MSLASPLIHTAAMAPKTPNGTAKMTAKGTDQLSYCAASTRNTINNPNANAKTDSDPAFCS